MSWFDGAGLGMFIHWDHASQQGLEVSWPLVGGVFSLPFGRAVSVEQYHSSAATFDPDAFDAPGLARLAKAAGMTYAVFTTRHHSGYSMWPTAESGFSVAMTMPGRDLVREFVDAFRAAGLRIGFYYSLSDWSHPDYPAFGEEHKPYVFGSSPPMPDDDTWARYLVSMREQLTELLTGYGTIDVVWFDGGWERPAAAWRPKELEAHLRSLQPQLLLNDRLPWVGDFSTPEQFVPAEPPARAWESCLTMNESWGFNPEDHRYKSARALVHTICEVVGRGGNLLLNVSPRGDGSLPAEQIERLEAVATWMGLHHHAVHGTTRAGDLVHLFLLARPYDSVTVRGVPIRRIRSVSLASDGRELSHRKRCGLLDQLLADPFGELTILVPQDAIDPSATVITIDIAPAS